MISAVVERCIGIDVGKKFVVACLMVGPAAEDPRVELRQFGTFNEDLLRLRDWIATEQCTHAVMESTGSYWKPVFNVLEETVTVVLANPHEIKMRKGHKTDWKDSRWLAHLLRHGMVPASFIPERGIRELRDLTRRRKQLISACVSEKNRIQKVLEDANVKLGSVLTDIFGVTGRAILAALLEDKLSPAEMARFAQKLAKRKIPEITASLEGHRLTETQRFLIRQSLGHLEFLQTAIKELEAETRTRIEAVEEYHRTVLLLQTIPGIREEAAAGILAEMGPRMEQYPSEKHLSSWVGLCPGNNKSAGVERSGHIGKGNHWLRSLIVECSWAASLKHGSLFCSKYRQLAPRIGGKRAVVAVGHAMLILIYQMLRAGAPYRQTAIEAALESKRRKSIQRHVKALTRLGVLLRDIRYPE
jgi:transposase